MSAPRHFLTLEDFTEAQLRGMLEVANELKARTKKGEVYVLALTDVYAGAVEESPAATRKAGFA